MTQTFDETAKSPGLEFWSFILRFVWNLNIVIWDFSDAALER